MPEYYVRKNAQGKYVINIPETPVEEIPAIVENKVKEIKAGWKTTEFWRSLAVEGLGLLAATGVLTPSQADAYTAIAVQGFGLLAMVLANYGYSKSRGDAKK